ncbi:MAG TPA: AMP-binding protein [Propionibacteriaceae bacterium]
MSAAGVGSARGEALVLVEPDDVAAALVATLSGGPAFAPLPPDPAERERVVAMLRPSAAVEEPDAAVIVATSGSTGRPKGVVLSRAALLASATATHERLGGPGDWALALPTHYVAGLMVQVRAVAGGTRVHVVRPDLSDLPAALPRLHGRRYLSLVPTQLRRALEIPSVATALSDFDAVLLGGAAADPALLEHARDAGVRIVTTYGMSETCGGCVYDGSPLTGVGVEIGDKGRIVIGGPTVFTGYRQQPELTAATLDGGRLVTHDRGRWRGDRLEVLGRVDEVVITGGLNVDLAEVERYARTWPALTGGELVVLGRADPEWGTVVVAVSDVEVGLDGLREFLRNALPAYAAPRELIRIDPLPRTSSGKIDREALRSLLQKGSA